MFSKTNLQIYSNGLFIISYQFVWVKIKRNAFLPVGTNTCRSLTYNKNRIKQFYIVEHLGCYLDANLSGESIHGIETS